MLNKNLESSEGSRKMGLAFFKALYEYKAISTPWVKTPSGLIRIGHAVCASQCPVMFPLVHFGFQIIRLGDKYFSSRKHSHLLLHC